MDCSLLVSSVHGILQARILEWVHNTGVLCNCCYHYNYLHYNKKQGKLETAIRRRKIAANIDIKFFGENQMQLNERKLFKRIRDKHYL